MPTAVTTADAERLFERGQLADALAAYEAILAADPESLRARARLGACLVGLGRHAEAIEPLSAAAALAPDQPLVRYRLAIARAALDDAEGALEALDAAAANGLRAVSGIDAEPAFERLRSRARFVSIRDRIARNDRPTADDPRFRRFDFWVGDWEARMPDGMLAGHNRIEVALEGAAIVERWTGISGYRGMSLNRYDRWTDRWRQTWVDDQGDIVEFEDGVAADGTLVFQAVDPTGRRRLTFTDEGPDAFHQLSERSDDDGATWTVEYDFAYVRRSGGGDDGSSGGAPAPPPGRAPDGSRSGTDLSSGGAAAGRSPARPGPRSARGSARSR